jgi:hypothetical protein
VVFREEKNNLEIKFPGGLLGVGLILVELLKGVWELPKIFAFELWAYGTEI